MGREIDEENGDLVGSGGEVEGERYKAHRETIEICKGKGERGGGVQGKS